MVRITNALSKSGEVLGRNTLGASTNNRAWLQAVDTVFIVNIFIVFLIQVFSVVLITLFSRAIAILLFLVVFVAKTLLQAWQVIRSLVFRAASSDVSSRVAVQGNLLVHLVASTPFKRVATRDAQWVELLVRYRIYLDVDAITAIRAIASTVLLKVANKFPVFNVPDFYRAFLDSCGIDKIIYALLGFFLDTLMVVGITEAALASFKIQRTRSLRTGNCERAKGRGRCLEAIFVVDFFVVVVC